jgi:HEAT repeat protein
MLGLLILQITLLIAWGMPVALRAAEPGPDQWLKILSDANADTLARQEAARKLGETREAKYLEPLAAALRDGNREVRWAAVEGLWALGDKRATPFLLDYLGKPEAYQWGKILTMNALAGLKDPSAVEPLLNMLKSESPFLRRSAALALVAIRDDRAIPGLIGLLKDEEGWLRRIAQELLTELTAGKIQGERPEEYNDWVKWHESNVQRVKIEGAKKE